MRITRPHDKGGLLFAFDFIRYAILLSLRRNSPNLATVIVTRDYFILRRCVFGFFLSAFLQMVFLKLFFHVRYSALTDRTSFHSSPLSYCYVCKMRQRLHGSVAVLDQVNVEIIIHEPQPPFALFKHTKLGFCWLASVLVLHALMHQSPVIQLPTFPVTR